MRSVAVFTLTTAFLTTAVARTIESSGDPRGRLNIVDWSQIRAAHERHRHTAFARGDGFEARNREQQFTARFTRRGLEIRPDAGDWRFGLEFMGQENPRMEVNQNRVTYTRTSSIEEWFVNDARGIEHGFTIRNRGALAAVSLNVRGDLRAEVDGPRVVFIDSEGKARLNYSGLKAWDANGRALRASMRVEGARLIRFEVDDRGATYPVTIDPLVQQAYLKPAAVGTTQLGDFFGNAVAVFGETVVVGAPREDSNTTGVNSAPNESSSEAGAVYVYVRNGATWTQQAYLKPANVGTSQTSDAFGSSVAISGDTLIIGAPGEASSTTGVNSTPNETAAGAGAAYIFVRTAGQWSQQAYLKPAAGTQAADHFGRSVAISGDTVVVGADEEDSSSLGVNSTPNEAASKAGAAYVFARTAGIWNQQAYLKPSAVGQNQFEDFFGQSVAISGDTIVVGAPYENGSNQGINSTANENAADAGAAYVFVRNGSAWSQQAYLKPMGAAFGDLFGIAVAISGDTIVVGANQEDGSDLGINGPRAKGAIGNTSGAAYVFVRTAGVWSEHSYLKPAAVGTSASFDNFGTSVAIAGDLIVVGATREDSSTSGVNTVPNETGFDSGAAYVFQRTSGSWRQEAYLKPISNGTQNFDVIGIAVGVSGNTVVVGAYLEDSSSLGVNGTPNESAMSAGAAYVWRSSGPEVTEVLDGASFRPEIAPSAWVTIKGSGLASTTRIWGDADFVEGRLPVRLDGVSVTIDGMPAAVYYVSPGQLNVLSAAFTNRGPVNVVVTTADGTATFSVAVKDRVPSWFMLDPDDRKYVAAVNLDGTIVGRTGLYPAAPNATQPLPARGGRAMIYGTGWGTSSPAVPEGVVFSGAYPLTSTATIKIGTVTVVVEFAGVVTPGLYQFNIVAPDLPPGDYLVEGSIAGQQTQLGAYITLGPPR